MIITLNGRELHMKKPAIYEEWAATADRPLRRKQIDGGYAVAAFVEKRPPHFSPPS